VERLPVVARVRAAERHVPEERLAERHLNRLRRLARHEPRRPAGFSTDWPSRKERLAVARDAAIDRGESIQLAGCETALAVRLGGAARQVGRRIEMASTRIVDEAVLQSISGVAFRIDR